ncbi:MAG TPA: hypothetical protein VGQ33_16510 [Vicinamibacteria bacterium]|nr:hypothetical protein [Vicinamibacteria bacterium]
MTQPIRRLAGALVLSLGALAATSSSPVHGAPPAERRPFQQKVRIVLPDGQCCDNGFVNVPAGKRLVIEYASATGLANGTQSFVFEVGTLVNGETMLNKTHYLPVIQQIQDGNTQAIAGQTVRFYADEGAGRVMLRASRTGAGEATVYMTVSGHLVNMP